MAKSQIKTNDLPPEDWYGKLESAAKPWRKWKSKIKVKGEDLRVDMAVEDYFDSLGERFYLRFSDRRGGCWDVSFETPLSKLKKDEAPKFVKKAVQQLSLRSCPSCKTMAFLDFNADATLKVCAKCSIKSWDELEKQIAIANQKMRQARIKAYAKKGFAYLIEAWIHADNGDDYLVEEATRTEPTKAYVKNLIKKRKGRMFGDYKVTPIRKP